jgi:hypothetical protein
VLRSNRLCARHGRPSRRPGTSSSPLGPRSTPSATR